MEKEKSLKALKLQLKKMEREKNFKVCPELKEALENVYRETYKFYKVGIELEMEGRYYIEYCDRTETKEIFLEENRELRDEIVHRIILQLLKEIAEEKRQKHRK